MSYDPDELDLGADTFLDDSDGENPENNNEEEEPDIMMLADEEIPAYDQY